VVTAETVGRVEGVYRTIHPKLWRALLTYTADREVASDAEAEAFAQALKRSDEIADVASWVWHTAFAIARGILKTRSRIDSRATVYDGAADATGSVAEFMSMLSGLTDQQRSCVVLRYMGGMDAGAIAAALSTTSTTVRVQLHRAHAVLRRSLAEEAGHG